jgi:hypothetical protein
MLDAEFRREGGEQFVLELAPLVCRYHVGDAETGNPERLRVVATVYVHILSISHASGQRVYRSTHVNKYLEPSDGGNRPTKSTCMCPKRRSGGAKGFIGGTVCLNTLVRWHFMQHLVQYLIRLFIPGQQYRVLIRSDVALESPWAWPCSPSNTMRRCCSGKYIRVCFVEVR